MEKKVEIYLKSKIESLGGLCVKFAPLFFAGFPDRIVLLPGGRCLFVELKAEGKTPGALQRRVHAALRALGFRVDVLDSKESVDKYLLSL